MAITYTFGESFTKGLATGSNIRSQAERLKGEIEDRKLRKEAAEATAEYRMKSLGLQIAGLTGEYQGKPTQATKQIEAGLTGLYGGEKTLAKQQLDHLQAPLDLSYLEQYFSTEMSKSLKKGGIDFSSMSPKNEPYITAILQADLSSKQRLKAQEEQFYVSPWISPEKDLPSGWGYNESDVVDDAKNFMTVAKSDRTIVRAIQKQKPDSPVVKKYIKELRKLKTELSTGQFTGWFDEMFSGKEAARMVLEINELLEYLGEKP